MKFLLFFLVLLLTADYGWSVEIPRRVADPEWSQYPDGRHFGTHRALVEVSAAAPAVRVVVPWRRPDADPARKDVRIVRSDTGQMVEHHAILAADPVSGDIVFGPVEPGIYELYYLPFEQTAFQLGSCPITYPEPRPDLAWQAAVGADRPETLPTATVTAFEDRSHHDSFGPMEVIATPDEVAALCRVNPAPFLLFPEDRRYPIRMRYFLPQRWIVQPPDGTFHGTAAPNEYFVWQSGIYPKNTALTVTRVDFSDLIADSGATIAAERQTCFNLTGSDYQGRDFTQEMPVAAGEVGALWFGLDLAADTVPGHYTGTVTVETAEAGSQTIALTLEVAGAPLADRGDSENWRLSRLRWINSKLGSAQEIAAPFLPIESEGDEVRVLNRTVTLDPAGLPASIRVQGAEILAAPIRFDLQVDGAAPLWNDVVRSTVATRPERAEWSFARTAGTLTLDGRAQLEPDGYLVYTIRLSSSAPITLQNAGLTVVQRPEAAGYLSGLDLPGGRTPTQHRWQWQAGEPNHHWWLGVPDRGLWCKLLTAQDQWLDGFVQAVGASGGDELPAAWHNQGRGGVTVANASTGVTMQAFSGERTLAAGEEVFFRFALLPTPIKPLDPRHFNRRYYTYNQPPAAVAKAAECTIETLFHGHPALAHINYPFGSLAALDAAIADARANGLRTVGYHTSGQISSEMAELWALRALPDAAPIFPGVADNTAGFYWEQEHLGHSFKPGWVACLFNGVWDSSLTTGGTSRYQNYYLESLNFLIRRGLGGIYLDGFGADRNTARRVNVALKSADPEASIDLHVANARVPWHGSRKFSDMCRNVENIAFFDSTWAGESYDFSMGPDQWLTEASGLVYGVYGDMLNDPNTVPNLWRGMLYGMNTRYYHPPESQAPEGFWSNTNWRDPRPVWRLWDQFGIADATMRGYWDAACPVKTGRNDILATVYTKPDRALIAIGSWSGRHRDAKTAVIGRGRELAAELQRFTPLNGTTADATAIGTTMQLYYDDANLYLDYQISSPTVVRRVIPAGGVGDIWEDDSFEFYCEVQPVPWQTELYQVIVNANGAWLARNLSAPEHPVPDVQVEVFETGGQQWSGRLTIPWRALNVPSAAPGQEIAFNLCRNVRSATGAAANYTWARSEGGYARSNFFGRLRLGDGEAPTRESADADLEPAAAPFDTVKLQIDFAALGFDPAGYELYQPAMAGMQSEARHPTDGTLAIPVDQGLFLILQPR